MAIDPTMMPGVSAPQGLSNTQINMPPQAQMVGGTPPGVPPDPAMMQPPMDPAMMGMMPPMAPPPEKKPSTLIPTDVARLLAEAINEAKMGAAKKLVEWVGDPRGTVNVKDADLLRIWRKRNPNVDPLYEKFINKLSDEDIMYAMYPARRALIRYGRRTYTEQVEFAEKMAKLDKDPRFDFLDAEVEPEDDEDDNEGYEPPKAEFPSEYDYVQESADEE